MSRLNMIGLLLTVVLTCCAETKPPSILPSAPSRPAESAATPSESAVGINYPAFLSYTTKPDFVPPWLPADTSLLLRAKPDQTPMLVLLRTMAVEIPTCTDRLVAQMISYYQVGRSWGDESANVFQGDFDRNATEQCLDQLLDALEMFSRSERDGPITTYTTARGKSFLGWRPDGYVVWADDLNRVIQLLQSRGGVETNARLVQATSLVRPTSVVWSASSEDLAQHITGVPSKGFLFEMFPSEKSNASELTILFSSEADVTRASVNLTASATRSDFSHNLRSAIVQANVHTRGSLLKLDPGPFMGPDVTQELIDLLRAKATSR